MLVTGKHAWRPSILSSRWAGGRKVLIVFHLNISFISLTVLTALEGNETLRERGGGKRRRKEAEERDGGAFPAAD